MKKSSLRAQMVKRTFCIEKGGLVFGGGGGSGGKKIGTHFVGVVEVEEFASVLIDHFVALATACHC